MKKYVLKNLTAIIACISLIVGLVIPYILLHSFQLLRSAQIIAYIGFGFSCIFMILVFTPEKTLEKLEHYADSC